MKLTQSIQLVDRFYVKKIIEDRMPKGLFLCREGKWWVAVDNSTYDAWTEDFTSKSEAICWLLRIDESP